MLAEFGDVGLMTGDVTINPTASCLVMTTEVRGASITALYVSDPRFLKKDSTVYALPRFRNYARGSLGHL